jgi:hypothetical protein
MLLSADEEVFMGISPQQFRLSITQLKGDLAPLPMGIMQATLPV